jgi:hypothetical protein
MQADLLIPVHDMTCPVSSHSLLSHPHGPHTTTPLHYPCVSCALSHSCRIPTVSAPIPTRCSSSHTHPCPPAPAANEFGTFQSCCQGAWVKNSSVALIGNGNSDSRCYAAAGVAYSASGLCFFPATNPVDPRCYNTTLTDICYGGKAFVDKEECCMKSFGKPCNKATAATPSPAPKASPSPSPTASKTAAKSPPPFKRRPPPRPSKLL